MPRLLRDDEIVDLGRTRHTNRNRRLTGRTLSEIDKIVDSNGFMPDLGGALTKNQLVAADKARQILRETGMMIKDLTEDHQEFHQYKYFPETRELYVGAVRITISNGASTTHSLLNSLNKGRNRSSDIGYAKYLRINKAKYFTRSTTERAIISSRKYIKNRLAKNGIDDFFINKAGLVVNKKYS